MSGCLPFSTGAGVRRHGHGRRRPPAVPQFHGAGEQIFTKEELDKLKGRSAIGHIRYSTTGSSDIKNAQPLFFNSSLGALAVAHNGNLTNAAKLRAALQKTGAIFQSTTTARSSST